MTHFTLSPARLAIAALAVSAGLLTSCAKGPEDPGTEYAPQMYHSIAYEDYTQITDTADENYNSNPYNPHHQNLRKPAAHTIARKYSEGQASTMMLAPDIMEYNIPSPDSINWSARNLHNPLPATAETVEQGKVLYTRFCAHCHGADGKGDGKVAPMYKGVPNYTAGATSKLNEGHIFHTITYGKGRMWPHGSQVMPEERWKIVRYVQTLQRGGAAPAAPAQQKLASEAVSTANGGPTAAANKTAPAAMPAASAKKGKATN